MEELSANKQMRLDIRSAAREGLPIYAECGGLMYLGEKLIIKSGTYEMTGVLPIVFGFSKKAKPSPLSHPLTKRPASEGAKG